MNEIILTILAITILIHMGPFCKGFYDGYVDARNGKPPKEFKEDGKS